VEPTIRSKKDAQDWLSRQLEVEGPRLWTDKERKDLARKLAQDYRPNGVGAWHLQEWTHDGSPVFGVTRSGELAVHTIDGPKEARDKALAVMRTLNALDREMRQPGESNADTSTPGE
jgi:hypothetical protein